MLESGPRVFDGEKWESIPPDDEVNGPKPVKPIVGEGNGDIFVAIPSFRDGERCATTIKALYDNAKEPEKVFVGLVEQNAPEDKECLIEYCKLHGVKIGKHTRRFDPTEGHSKCPHYSQIRYLAVYNIGAKGPVYARSLHRKIIGNEEYCLQIDSHSDFTQNWDMVAKDQWLKANNEYAIISTIPPPNSVKSQHEPSGNKHNEVRRLCHVNFAVNGVPWYDKKEGIKAVDLQTPLLSHAWNAGFSFAKCHLEENAPYDNFMKQIFDVEEFPRYARFWTRGYDVYTPTRNIVYHKYDKPEDGHDPKGWTKNELERKEALKRIKTLLQLVGGDNDPKAYANLGIYGLGKRRSLSQLETFVGIDLKQKTVGNSECGKHDWVAYDLNIGPMENAYEGAEDMDPQPEFPLRKSGTMRRMSVESDLKVKLDNLEEKKVVDEGKENGDAPVMTLSILWFLGLLVWYVMFVGFGKDLRRRRKKVISGHKDM